MRHHTHVPLLLAALALTVAHHPAAAAWPHDPYAGNVPLCTAAGGQVLPTIASDGADGAIVTWEDVRGANTDIYAQRVNAAGVPLWGANGVALCTAAGEQFGPTVATDGAGGAIVTWYDHRSGTGYKVYAQRVNAAGAPQWATNGIALCPATADQTYPAITADGVGGAIIAWNDFRGGPASDIYAQRISATGALQWAASGIALSTATGDQQYPAMTSDGAGGAIATWYDYRGGTTSDIYAQRISATGTTAWTADGVPVCTAANNQFGPTLVSDGAGGAMVTWYDYRSGSNYHIYTQHLDAAGAPQWTANGLAVCTAAGNQNVPAIVLDGAGGAIVSWQDSRSGVFYDIYAQRVSAAGVAQWTADGVAVCAATDNQLSPTIASDTAGGAIIAWQDYRGTDNDVYAQRLTAAGTPQWAADGVAVCTAPGNQYTPLIVSDGAGGAIAAWYDYRGLTTSDIYAQRIDHFGQLGDPAPAITQVKDVPNDQGGLVKLSWNASYLDAGPTYGVFQYRVFRSAPSALAARADLRRAITTDSDIAVHDGALLARMIAGTTVYWEYAGSQAAETFAGYSMLVGTTSDSTTSSNPRTLFMVEAVATFSLASGHWSSAPDSGYSVDNLPPAVPGEFLADFAAGATHLHWRPGAEVDLAGYRLYRGTSASFTPGPSSLVAVLADTGFVDPAGAAFVYELTAVDSHGNESPAAISGPGVISSTGIASGLVFSPPSPNPACRSAALRFALPIAEPVQVAIFDAQGRIERVLADRTFEAGAHELAWDLRDDAGRVVGAGIYFARISSGHSSRVRRLVVAR